MVAALQQCGIRGDFEKQNLTYMQTNYQKIYEQLGYLFYAVAAADKMVKPADVEKLKELVHQKWEPLEGTVDEFANDAAYCILISFDYLLAEDVSAKEAFLSFEEYFREHERAFTGMLRRRISDTAVSIAHVFCGTNKAELNYLVQLHTLITDNKLVKQMHG